MNKNSIVLTGAAALVAIIAVSGFAFSSFAQDTEIPAPNNFKGFGMMQDLNEDERADMRAQKEAMRLEWEGLTDEERTTKKEEMTAQRTERREEMQAKHEAVEEALDNSDYGAFQVALEGAGENNPFAGKITEENFPQMVEAHEHFQAGKEIMEELGIEMPGPGEGKGMRGGRHGGMRGGGQFMQ